MVSLHIPENRGLDAAEREIKSRPGSYSGSLLIRKRNTFTMRTRLDLAEVKRHRPRIPPRRKCIDPRTSGIAQAKQLGDLVVGLPCRVIDRAANIAIDPRRL